MYLKFIGYKMRVKILLKKLIFLKKKHHHWMKIFKNLKKDAYFSFIFCVNNSLLSKSQNINLD